MFSKQQNLHRDQRCQIEVYVNVIPMKPFVHSASFLRGGRDRGGSVFSADDGTSFKPVGVICMLITRSVIQPF